MIFNKLEHSISVIYKITNTVNGKIYVGSAVDFYNRYMVYKATFNEENRLIARAMRKYGFEAFEFSILEKVDDRLKLAEREQFYMDFYHVCDRNIGYNIAPIAYSNVGVKHTEEAKKNMSLAQSGRTQSKETVARRLQSFRDGGGYLRVSKAKSKPVIQIDVNTLQIIQEFSSCVESARSFNQEGCHSVISKVCRKKKNMRTAFGFFWAFKSEYDKLTYKPTPKVRKMSPHFYEGNRPVIQYDLAGQELAIWESCGDAAHYVRGEKGSHSAITQACHSSSRTAYGFKWKYVEDSIIIAALRIKRKREYDREKNARDLIYADSIR